MSNPPHNVTLELGAIVKSSSGGPASVGAFVVDTHFQLYFLTVRSVFDLDNTDTEFYELSDVRVGYVENEFRLSRNPSLSDSIVAVRLDKGVQPKLPMCRQIAHKLQPAPIDSLLESAVTLKTPSGEVAGIVSGTYVSARIEDATHKTSIYFHSGIEAKFSNSPPFQPGDAGSLAVTDEGQAIGLLVAGAPDRALIAPLGPFLDHHKLSLLRPERLDQHALASHVASLLNRAERVWESEPEIGGNLPIRNVA